LKCTMRKIPMATTSGTKRTLANDLSTRTEPRQRICAIANQMNRFCAEPLHFAVSIKRANNVPYRSGPAKGKRSRSAPGRCRSMSPTCIRPVLGEFRGPFVPDPLLEEQRSGRDREALAPGGHELFAVDGERLAVIERHVLCRDLSWKAA
jgi:hypothetical protein